MSRPLAHAHASTAGEPPPLLAAHRLVRREGARRLLGPLDLEVRDGEAVAVVGPNGAGKTTLLRLLAGILPPSEGAVRLRGHDLAKLPRHDAARSLVYLPQHPPVAVPLTVERYLLLASFPRHASRRLAPRGPDAADARAVSDALAAADLEALRHRSVAALSGGERQLVQLAGALVQGGDCWLVDEPTAHLDPAHQRRVARLLAALHAAGSGPRTLLLATHDLNLASRLASRVIALADGIVAAEGAPADVLDPDRLATLYGSPFGATGTGDERRLWIEL